MIFIGQAVRAHVHVHVHACCVLIQLCENCEILQLVFHYYGKEVQSSFIPVVAKVSIESNKVEKKKTATKQTSRVNHHHT